MKTTIKKIILFCSILSLAGCKQENTDKYSINKPYPIVGQIEILDSLLLTVIDTASPIEVIAQGFNWSEGPLWLASPNKLIFSDVPENIIYSWDESNGIQIYLKSAGFTGSKNVQAEGSNGLALDSEGHLIICQHGDRAVAMMDSEINQPRAVFKTLATRYKDKKLNSPNDLCFSQKGDLFFTDPPYGLPGQDSDSSKELNFNGVYRLTPKGDIILLDAELSRPNGIALSKDERYLYVANSDPEKAIWMEYRIDEFLNVTGKKILLDKTSDVSSKKGLPDGLKVHSSGYLFATGPGGVLIIHPDGRHLGTINTEQATANCAFDSKENYLYMTADDYLMRVKLRK